MWIDSASGIFVFIYIFVIKILRVGQVFIRMERLIGNKGMDYKEKLQSADGFVGNPMAVPAEIQVRAKTLCWKYNQTAPTDGEQRREILKELLGTYNDCVYIEPAVRMDYGFNVHFHGLAIVNYNCVFLDTSPIHIGKGAFIAPGVVMSCASHPINSAQRATEPLEISKPITVEDNVWIGANAVICGGVTIGEGSVIGAGAVVNRDIPAGVVAAGVPCRVLRDITEQDRIAPEQIVF